MPGEPDASESVYHRQRALISAAFRRYILAATRGHGRLRADAILLISAGLRFSAGLGLLAVHAFNYSNTHWAEAVILRHMSA